MIALLNISGKKILLISILFLLSGIAGLMYQVVWFKHLSYFLGNTTYSQVVVLSTFMGGLAIGSWWWGKKADESENPLKLAAYLEISIALYCLFYIPIFDGIKIIFIELVKSQGWPSDGNMVLSLKFLICSLTLLFPTILMGGTIPILVRYLSNHISVIGKNISILYFVNSLGAVFGSILAGFYLIQKIGLTSTVFVGALMDLLVGLVFLWIVHLSNRKAYNTKIVNSNKNGKKEGQLITQIQYNIVLIIALTSGFCAMAYEIIWLRLLIPILSSSTYSFTLILTVFIFGITLGSLLVYFILPKIKNQYNFLAICQIGIIVSVLLTIPFYERIPYMIWSGIGENLKTLEGYYKYLSFQFFYSSIIMILPTIFMGMCLPVVSKLSVNQIKNSGEKIGRAFALNTLGTVMGSVLTGIILIPLFGIGISIDIVLFINVLMVILILSTNQLGRLTRFSVLLMVLVGLGIVKNISDVDYRTWAYSIMMSEVPRKVNRIEPPKSFDSFIRQQKEIHDNILFYEEGLNGTFVVAENDQNQVYLYTNGKADANSKTDFTAQSLLAHIPLVLHNNPDSVFVIGFGAGTTIGNVLNYREVRFAQVAEISKEVIDASVHFEHINNQPLNDSRLSLIKDDGISALKLSPYSYDIIISQPSNPWSAGVGNLFTANFFQDCKSKLKSGGVLAQWFNLYEMNDKILKLVLRTLRSEFDNLQIWQIGGNDILILCSNEQLKLDIEKSKKSFLEHEEYFERLNIKNFPTFLSLQINNSTDHISIYAFDDDNLINTEDFPILEFDSPFAYFMNNQVTSFLQFDNRDDFAKHNLFLNNYIVLNGALTSEEEFHLGMYHSIYGNKNLSKYFSDINAKMNIAWGIQRRKENKFDEALNYFIKAKSLNSNDIVLFEELIRLYLQRKDLRKALEEVSAAISEYPLYDVFYSLRGTILSNQGEIDLAEKDFLEAISLNQENASNFNDLGLMYASESMFDKAIITFSKGIVQDKRNEKLFFNRGLCYSYLNNISSAIADLTRAIELTPKNVQFFMLRADLYMKLNNKKKACGDWNSALQLGFRPAKSFLFTNSCN